MTMRLRKRYGAFFLVTASITTPMISLSFMIRSSASSILTSVPDHLPNKTRSPTLRSIGMTRPASSRPPGPTATISPWLGFSLAVSGMMMPPVVLSSASIRLTTTRSCSGRNFIGVSLSSDISFDLSHTLTGRSASGERILDALVQPANSVAVEPLVSDFQLSRLKKFRWQFLDQRSGWVRGVANRPYPGCRKCHLNDYHPNYPNYISRKRDKTRSIGENLF